MEYNLRKLTSSDIFPVCTIIKKVGIDEVKRIINSPEMQQMLRSGEKADAASVGMSFMLDIASLVVGNLPKCEQELYKFLASVSGETEKSLRAASPAEFFELIVLVIKHEDFKDFFKAASSLLK